MNALDKFKQALTQCQSLEDAIAAYRQFLRDWAIEVRFFDEPKVYKSASDKARKLIKAKFPKAKSKGILPPNWLNTRGLRDEDGNLKPLDERVEAAKAKLKECDAEFYQQIYGETKVTETIQDAESIINEEIQTLLDELKAKEAELKAVQKRNEELEAELQTLKTRKSQPVEQQPTQALLGSRQQGAADELVRRAIEAVMKHNDSTNNPDMRYQISLSVLKTMTGVNNKAIQKYIGYHPAKGEPVLGKMENNIKVHHQNLGISESPVFNRGKQPIDEVILDW